MRKLFFLLVAALATSMFAQETPFKLTNDDNIHLEWRGTPLILGENFSYLGKDGFASGEKREETIDGCRVVNHFGEKNRLGWRRELAFVKNGAELEITFQMNVPGYTPAANGNPQAYILEFNWKALEGWKYTAVIGRISKASTLTGVLSPEKNGDKIILDDKGVAQRIRQIALESPDGSRKLVLDCSPEGTNDPRSDYPPNGLMGLWVVYRKNNSLFISVGSTPPFYGGSNTGKMVIYEGSAEDYDRRHANRSYRYYSELPPDRLYALAAKNVGKMYNAIGTAPFSAELKAGWLPGAELKTEEYRPSGALYSAVSSASNAVFRMEGLRSGIHLLTFGIPAFDKARNGMGISVNGKPIVDKLKLEKKTVTLVSAPVWIENGRADIGFTGQWQVATIGDQLLQASAEDFSFRRGMWVSHKGPSPAVIFQSEHYLHEPKYNIDIESYPLPEPGQEMAAERKQLEYPTGYAVFDEGKDWRHASLLGTWGTGNGGSFAEFTEPGAVEKRLDELTADEIDTVIVSGFLSRHTYPMHLERIDKMLAKIVSEGHKRNMKFIDHIDFSLLWQCDSGFRVLTERMEQLQHTVNTGLPNRGLCPTNPYTRRRFFNDMVQHIKATGIDGLMADEVAFHGENFCGCSHCRKQFTQDTGWVLPADENSPHIMNNNSTLWHAWIAWRQKAIGDFWLALRQEVRKFKPDFVFIGYTTHYGIYSNWASCTLASSMDAYSRTYDMVGTEIMTRNGFASYRALASMRKLKNMFRNVNHQPIFGLVYSDVRDWDIMYFGWAMNNLNAQTTWEMSGMRCPEGKPNYRSFNVKAGNMDRRTAVSQAKIALFFSSLGRDCSKRASSEVDIMGFSQVMVANHIPHEFIYEAGLTKEILSNYKALFVNNATAMSEENVKAIRDYVEAGGIVYLSNNAGYFNEIADKPQKWLVGQMLLNGSDYLKSDSNRKYSAVRWKDGKELAVPGQYQPYRFAKGLGTLMDLVLANGKTVPGLYYNKLGKGCVYFSPAIFGQSCRAYEVTSKATVKFQANPLAEENVLRVINTVADDFKVWQPIDIPSQVITSIYKTQEGSLALHFLNATRSNYKKGDVIPSVPPKDAFAPLEKPFSFKVKYPGKKAYAVSPEFKKPVLLPLQNEGEWTTVTVPAGTLGAYMIVYVTE